MINLVLCRILITRKCYTVLVLRPISQPFRDFKFNHKSTPSLYFSSMLKPKTPSFDQGQQKIYTFNKSITFLIRTGNINEARIVFDKMERKNTITWNSMLSGYVKQREMSKARELFDRMPERDVVLWNLMIFGYISCRGKGFLGEGRFLFDRMPNRDCVSWNTMISGYARNGRMDEALLLFDSMPERNVVSSNAMITRFLQNGDVAHAIGLFQRMPERDLTSLSALVSGLIQNGELDEAARVLLECGDRDDGGEDMVHAYNTLITGYGQRGRVEEARKVFDLIPLGCDVREEGHQRLKRNIVSWNSMIMCYVKAGDIVSTREIFDQMTERDTFSWNTMISGYVQVSDMEEASKLFHLMPNPDTLSWNSMISGFAQMSSLEVARTFFERMPQRNLYSWNSMIARHEKNEDYEGAIKLFTQMQAEGEKPDGHNLSSVLSVCTRLVDLHLGMQIHQLVTKTVTPDVPISNSLITMYSRCGAISEARTTFDEMQLLKDVISWNAMIRGYASHGFTAEALELFELMTRIRVHPTYITFIAVLNACVHVGLMDEGRQHFRAMVSEYGIMPRVEHFASLVDLLGRHGQLEEAMELINSMPCVPDKAVWGALLGVCRVHNNVEFARVAAEALMRLEQESSAPYVLLHNMFADVGRWDDATEMRMMIDKNDVKKQRAYSWIDSSVS